MRGLFGLKNKSFDCISISVLVTLWLIKLRIPAFIGRVAKVKNSKDAHSFIIVNHTQGDIHNIHSLNRDCIFIDPWYKIFKNVAEILADPSFFSKYPLLSLDDKTIVASTRGDNPASAYQKYLKKFDNLPLETSTSCEQIIGLDTIFPTLP